MTQSCTRLLPITRASGTLVRSAITHYQCQGGTREKCGAGRICTVTICGSLRPIWGSVITVRLRLGIGFGSWLGSGLKLRLGLGLGLMLQIVVYKLLEKAKKSGSMMWLKLTNGDAPCRSAPLRILSCPCQGKVRVIDGQCLQTNKQSHIVLQLNRGGSKTSTGDAQLTIWLVNCAYCNGTSSNLSSYSYLSVCCSQLILPLFSVEVWCLRWHSDRSVLIRN